MTTASPWQVRPDYQQDSEAAANRQISLELYATYVYLSTSYYLDPDDVALKNFAKYFLHQSHEERERAEKLMKLQNQRGGRMFLRDIKKPARGSLGGAAVWRLPLAQGAILETRDRIPRRAPGAWSLLQKKPALGDGPNATECALHLEKSVNQSLLELHKLATDKNAPLLCDFVETHYLHERVRSIKELGGHVTNLRKVGAPEPSMAGISLTSTPWEPVMVGAKP
ncbi:ferritin heavy chain-like isoform X1 [Canis lupus familiaris]|uniref:ferritin heavy chain-like isoform X1 n=1 Tax=Canis lupus familiaris TaxID=9615 RepID=UPI0018F3D181|nr:ferritin heavy chain-like isoform X1 [Canis lupus familiaris]